MPKRNFKLCRWRDEGEKNLKGPRQFFVELLPNHSTEAGYFILILTSKDSQPEDLDEVPKGAGIWKDGARESRAFKEPQPGSCTSSVSPASPLPPTFKRRAAASGTQNPVQAACCLQHQAAKLQGPPTLCFWVGIIS